MKALKTGLFSFLFLFSAITFAQDFERFDRNDDDMWDENEFNSSFTEDNFNAWDSDEDMNIEENEFYDTTFGSIDNDRNYGINEEEWMDGSNDMFGDYADLDDFETFDADSDGIIDNDEWRTGFGNTEWFNTYDSDRDGFLNNDELNTGVFNDWDNDNDGFLNRNEYADNSGFFETW